MASADPKRHSGAGQPPPYEESQGRPLSTSVIASPRFYIAAHQDHNRVLDVYGENTTDGTRVVTWPMKKDQRALNQLWYIGPQGYIRSALTGFLLDAHPNGKQMVVRRQVGEPSPSQQWQLIADTSGRLMVANLQHNMVIEWKRPKFFAGKFLKAEQPVERVPMGESNPYQFWRKVE